MTNYTFEDLNNNSIAPIDLFQSLEGRFNGVIELQAQIEELKRQQELLIKDVVTEHRLNDARSRCSSYDSGMRSLEIFKSNLNKSFWEGVFKQTKIGDVATSKVQKEFVDIQNKASKIPFTKENLYKFLSNLYDSRGNIVNDAIDEAFDRMTKYHINNRFREGFKTNDQFKVNKKVIFADCNERQTMAFWGTFLLNKRYEDAINDIEKALCFIDGKNFDQINPITSIISRAYRDERGIKTGKWIESTFFTFKCFKKGTIHLKWKSDLLWVQFNKLATKNKNWLGY